MYQLVLPILNRIGLLLRTFTYVHLDASLLALWKYLQAEGIVRGLLAAWPVPSLEAWTHIFMFGALQAMLQMLLPGREHKGPITPKGNVPVYKVRHKHVSRLVNGCQMKCYCLAAGKACSMS